MHVKILQLETTPVKEDERIEESDFYDLHLPFDYYADLQEEEIDEEWQAFQADFKLLGAIVESDHVIFTEEYRKNYFAGRLEALRKWAENTTDEEFSGSNHHYYIGLKHIHDRLDHHVSGSDMGTVCMDYFVRSLKIGQPYYFGGMVDAHY